MRGKGVRVDADAVVGEGGRDERGGGGIGVDGDAVVGERVDDEVGDDEDKQEDADPKDREKG